MNKSDLYEKNPYEKSTVSRKGKALARMLYRTSNMNSANTSDPIQKFKKMDKLFKIRRAPAGFKLVYGKTSTGVKYMQMEKEGVKKNGQVMLYFHGGAYVSGLTSLYTKFLALAYDMMPGCVIICLDYKCAPDYRYPRQLKEALSLWKELTNPNGMGYDPKKIVLGGDSAGANLALSMMLKLRDEGKLMPVAAFLLSAWGDLSGKGESFTNNYGKDIFFGEKGKELTKERWEEIIHGKIFSFAGDEDRTNPYVSPVYGDFHDFPPMCFVSGSHEMLLSDTLTMVENARTNGVEVEFLLEEGMFHIFTVFARFCPEGMRSLEWVSGTLTEFLQNVRNS